MTKKRKNIRTPKATPSTPQKPTEEGRLVKFSFDSIIQNIIVINNNPQLVRKV